MNEEYTAFPLAGEDDSQPETALDDETTAQLLAEAQQAQANYSHWEAS